MFKNIFDKKTKDDSNKTYIMVAALLIHAAKMDENYTDNEEKIISKAIIELRNGSNDKLEEILNLAKKKEEESNQILEFTKEIKKNPMEFRLKIIEILWKIVYSDYKADQYEANLMRRISGLLYVSDKDSGEIKLKVKKTVE